MNHIINETHNELVKNGWSCVAGPCVAGPCKTGPFVAKAAPSLGNKLVYRKTQPYDEFIIEQYSPDEVSITVPIPFRDSSIAYKNIFRPDNMNDIQDYIKLHLCNNSKR